MPGTDSGTEGYYSSEIRAPVRKNVSDFKTIGSEIELHGLYACLVGNASDTIFLINAAGEIVFVNRCIESYPGLTVEGLVGKHFSTIMHPDDVQRAINEIVRVIASQGSFRDFDFRAVLPNGQIRWLIANGAMVTSGSDDYLLGICRDITESVELHEKLTERNRALSALNAVVVALSSADSLEVVLQRALERLIAELRVPAAAIILREFGSDMRIAAVVGANLGDHNITDGYARSEAVQICVSTGKSVIVDDVTTDSRFSEEARASLLATDVQSGLLIPLKSGDVTTAALALSVPSPGEYLRKNTEFLNLAAGVLGPAIENARLHADLADRVSRLAILERLAKSINAGRDVESTLNACMRGLLDLIKYDLAVVILFESDTDITIFKFAGDGTAEPPEKMRIDAADLRKMAMIRTPVVLKNGNSVRNYHSRDYVPLTEGAGTVAPLLYKEQPLGLLKVWSNAPSVVGTRELEILNSAAEHLAIAVCNARLYEAELIKSRQLEALAKEAQHRIKNNLQMITGLLGMSCQQEESAWTATRRCLRQVQAIATVYDLLDPEHTASEVGLRTCLGRVAANALLATGRAEEISLSITGTDLPISADAATALGIIINELVSNSVEHAFVGRCSGKIDICASCANGESIVEIMDDGVGLPAGLSLERLEDQSSGLGLVASLARYGLGGELEFAPAEVGACIRVKFQLARSEQ